MSSSDQKTRVARKAPAEIVPSRTGIFTLPGVKTERITTLVIGTAPLIVHNFSHKARGMILAKHTGEAVGGREKKNIEANFQASRYIMADGGDGVPAAGLKGCIVDGCSKESGVPMTKAKGGIRVVPDCVDTNLVRLILPEGVDPNMREDVVRNESGVVDIRHRAEYWPWALEIQIEFLPTVASARQVLQAVAVAGFTVGLCEWRPMSKKSKTGSFGTFRLATEAEVIAHEDGDLFGQQFEQAAE